MLEAKNITKNYNDVTVLKGVNLNIKNKEIVSILGSSGAGKTTLLQILGTLDKPSSGEVIINGINPEKISNRELSKLRNTQMGFIFQFHQLLPEFTALENVCLPGLIAKKNKKKIEKEAKELLNYLGLNNRNHHKPSQLSGGEQQRVAVARALINKPSFIFADEPSGNLDSKNSNELHHLFFKLRDEMDVSIVIVTHNNTLANLSDRRIILKDGVVSNIN